MVLKIQLQAYKIRFLGDYSFLIATLESFELIIVSMIIVKVMVKVIFKSRYSSINWSMFILSWKNYVIVCKLSSVFTLS